VTEAANAAARPEGGEGGQQPIPCGDPSNNAESQSLRRALANFGLGLDLYEG
jgi:hypothetical protein